VGGLGGENQHVFVQINYQQPVQDLVCVSLFLQREILGQTTVALRRRGSSAGQLFLVRQVTSEVSSSKFHHRELVVPPLA
jgi:hypothetical protein